MQENIFLDMQKKSMILFEEWQRMSTDIMKSAADLNRNYGQEMMEHSRESFDNLINKTTPDKKMQQYGEDTKASMKKLANYSKEMSRIMERARSDMTKLSVREWKKMLAGVETRTTHPD